MQFINSIHNHFMTRVSWNFRSCGYGAYVTTMETATATATRTSTEKKRPLLRKTTILAFSRRSDSGGWREMESGGKKKEALSPYSHPLSTYSHSLFPPDPTPSLLTPTVPLSCFFASYPLSERLKQANFSTFRFRHCTTTKWNFLTSNFKFYGGRRQKMKFFFFFPWTWIRFLRIQLQKYSARFDKFLRSNVFIAMNFETAQIPFLTLTF